MDAPVPRGGLQRWLAVATLVVAFGLLALRSLSVSEATAHPTTPQPPPSSLPRERTEARISAARAIARTLAPHPSRRLPAPSPHLEGLHRLASSLRAPGAPVENPCVEWAGPFCSRTALEPFFSSLDGLRSGTASSRVTVSAFGNSLIASDRIVDIVREELVHTFGDGGRGLLLVDRMAEYGPRTRTGHASGGWRPYTVGDIKPSPLPIGLTGVIHVSTTPKARSRFPLAGETLGSLFWLDQDAGPIELHVDGQHLVTTTPANTGGQQRTDFTLPQEAKALELVAHERGTVIQGISLDRTQPGIVLDTLGVPAADSSLFLLADEEMVTQQLRSRDPSLVLIMLGGNEVKRLQWGKSTYEKVERDLRRFIHRIQQASPRAACLLVGPLDAVLGPKSSRPFQQREDLLEVIELERRIALEEGCAFFDLFSAMGGTGSIERFNARGLVHDDLVHPRGKGLDVLGALLGEGLLRAWSDTPRTDQPYALAEAWATLLGGDLLPHEVELWRLAPPVALLLPEDSPDPLAGGIQRVLTTARAWAPRSEEAQWLVFDPGAASGPPRPIATSGPVSLRCAALLSQSGPAPGGQPCLPVTLPPLPPDLNDPLHRGVAAGAWLLAELVRHDSISAARRQR